jgi:radical SAM superfamily enzyme YgiQ (UPF0313 family)
MKIVLVSPPHWYRTRSPHVPESSPLGLMYIASMLREQHEMIIYDAEYKSDTPTSLAYYLKGENPDVVGFTCTILTFHEMNDCIMKAREYLPKAKIMIGGPHITSLPEEELRELDFDMCVVGECEGNILELTNTIKGMKERTIVEGRPIERLDDIPFPSRDLLVVPVTKYRGNMPRYKKPETQMMWSRGCPHACIFCANSVFGHQPIRYRTPENILAELWELYHLGIRSVFVYDDEVMGQSIRQTKWMRQVCNLIIESGLHKKIVFKAQARCTPRVFGLEDLQLMRKAGFRALMWGIESGSPKVLKAIRKGISPDDVRQTFAWCKEAKIQTYAFMMVGSWDETLEDIEMSKMLMRDIKPNWIQWTICTPMRPTVFRELVKDLIDTEAKGPVYFYDTMCSTPTMTRAEIFKAYQELNRENQRSRYMTPRRIFKLMCESVFTARGRRLFKHRAQKYRKMRKEGTL